MNEEYSVGYSEGYQAGWNEAIETTPPAAQRQWVEFDHLTQNYRTPDSTAVAAEIIDNVQCLADILHIAGIRQRQREKMAAQPPCR